jgi:branched-chain amino acid transport system ATP-binding protein
MNALEAEGLHSFYGKSHILHGIDLCVGEGQIVAVLGRNGAGKTTTLRSLMGLTPPRQGAVRILGQTTTRWPPFRVAALGVGYVPEGRRIFANLTVRENLEMGAYARKDGDTAKDFEKVYGIFPRLKEREKQTGGTLSGGEQQMLAIGRALMSRPRVLLLDEPSLGLAPLLVGVIFEAIEAIHRQGTPVLLVEQNANAALKHSNRAYVLETGHVALEGPSSEVAANPRVKEAYLGE